MKSKQKKHAVARRYPHTAGPLPTTIANHGFVSLPIQRESTVSGLRGPVVRPAGSYGNLRTTRLRMVSDLVTKPVASTAAISFERADHWPNCEHLKTDHGTAQRVSSEERSFAEARAGKVPEQKIIDSNVGWREVKKPSEPRRHILQKRIPGGPASLKR